MSNSIPTDSAADGELERLLAQARERCADEAAKRRRAEQALRKSEGERLRILDELIGVFVCRHDANGTFEYVSNSITGVLGYTPKEFLTHFTEYLTGHPVNQEACEHTVRSIEGIQQPPYEVEIFDKSGETRWLAVAEVPVRDAEGTVVAVEGLAHDITDRKKAEEALRESESKFRALYDSTNDAVMILDEECFLDCNLATLDVFRCASRDEFCGKHPSDLSPLTQPCGTESLALANQRISTALEYGSNRFEWIHKRADGTDFPAEVLLIAMTSGDRQVLQAVVRDITDRRAAEEELQRATKAADAAHTSKSEFLANMSHEIRTPMTAILGFTDTLLEDVEVTGSRREAIEAIKRNGRLLVRVINDILDLSKVETGKMALELVAYSPCQLVAEVVSPMRVLADAKELELDIEYGGPVPETIQTDPTRLRQILTNLIANAVKFTPGGRVAIVVQLDSEGPEPHLQFDVVDTGVGMTQEQVAKLFQPFSQADTSAARRFGGTGLGLAICKRLALLLGGDIELVETHHRGGSRFRAWIPTGSLDGIRMVEDPLSPAVVVPEASPAPARAGEPELHGCRILLAEDNPDNQILVASILKKAGAEVATAENGAIAAEAAMVEDDADNAFDVILMDMQMPVLDGYEATTLLRRQGYMGTIIALTAHAMKGDREKCLSAGCDDYFTKPINRKMLITLIRDHLQNVKHGNNTRESVTNTRTARLSGCRILLADNDPTHRASVTEMLEDAGAEVRISEDSGPAMEAALAMGVEGSPFEVILRDMQMPSSDDQEAATRLRKVGYTGAIIALTTHMPDDDEEYVMAGYDSYVAKPIDREKLIRAVGRVLETVSTLF